MAQIFISYAREDFKQVSELRQRLKDEGFTTWMDKVDLLAGQRWRPAIEQAVRESDFFVLCLSNRTVSKRSFVQREIKMALDLWQEMLTDDIFLIPVLLEHIEPSEIPVSIREIGWVFLFEEDGWDDLMRALKHGMKQRSIDERDERKKEDDVVRQAAAEAARIERDAAEQRLRQETVRLKKEKAEIERKLQEQTSLRQQETAAELRRQTEAAQQQKELAEQQQREARERERVERQRQEEASRTKSSSQQTPLARGKGSQLWSPVAVAILLVGLLGYWAWHAFRSGEVQTQTSYAPITTLSATPASGNGQTFEFETVRLNASGGEVQRQKLRAEYFTENLGKGVSLDMVKIPGGKFMMGSPSTEAQRGDDEGPQHSVNVSSFWMGKFEITQAQWQVLMNTNLPYFDGDGNKPVAYASWNDAQEFLMKLNALPNMKGKNYRLPTEAEWEYAARARTTTPFAFGETITPEIANYRWNYPYANVPKKEYLGKILPVGSSKVANAFGLFDMHGNVYEWCQDFYHDNYSGAPSDNSAWLSGGDSIRRVLRGGALDSDGKHLRSASRHSGWLRREDKDKDIVEYNPEFGFRVVCARTP